MNPVEEAPMIPQEGISGPAKGFLGSLVKTLVRLYNTYGYRLNRVLPKDGSEAMEGPLTLMEYTDSPDTKPTASDYPGSVIYVSDGGSGAVFRGSDGTNWVNLG